VRRIRNFLLFWRQALISGGRLALALGGLTTLVVGGSLLAYVQLAHHKATFVLIGAAVAVLIVMIAAYLQWEALDRELSAVMLTPVSDQHAGQLRDILAGLNDAVGKSERCPELEPLGKEVFAAHFPSIEPEVASWNHLLTLPPAADAALLSRLQLDVSRRPELESAPYDPDMISSGIMHRLRRVAEEGSVADSPPLPVKSYPPDGHIFDGLAYAMGLEMTFTAEELEKVVGPVERLWHDALNWPETHQYEAALRSVVTGRESFGNVLARQEIRDAYPIATACPICGAAAKR
jgi:hypothetical protein